WYLSLDPSEPAERLGFMVDDARTTIVLAEQPMVDRFRHDLPTVESLDLNSSDSDPAEGGSRRQNSEPDNLAYVVYTSDSTGAANGVAVTHRAILRLVKGADCASLTPEETVLQIAPISFDASTFEIWGSLLNGATLVVMPPGPSAPHELASALERHRVTTLWLTAPLFRVMAGEQVEALRNIRQLLTGGEELPVARANRYLDGQLMGTLINSYGPAATTAFACCHKMTAALDGEHNVPIGQPISGMRAYISDQNMSLVPVGVTGELLIAGAGLARGFQNRPDLTAARFIPDPFSEIQGGRAYKTGDLVRYLADGRITFDHRADRQTNIRGFRVD
ncbi:MAG: AMP-binding protein, partial [Blastocatellia bacterium]